jgi:BirA family transcriptional regulator, biotin operon repressor / biotin---[acetyl-CoA-carboxylase] ligase
MKKFDVKKYRKLSGAGFIGKNIIYLKRTDSTNDYASQLIKKNNNRVYDALNGTIVLAETQKKGRGRLERPWLSPPGGLWFSILLKTELEEKKLPEITLIGAYSVVYVLNKDYGIRTTIKWPNDIYYQKFKLGGILTEVEKINNYTFIIIGLGININIYSENLKPFDNKSTSVKDIPVKNIGRELFLSRILHEFENNYNYYSLTKDFNTIFKNIKKFLYYGI